MVGKQKDQLKFYGQSFSSRLLLGTARYDSHSLLADAISAANPAMLADAQSRHEHLASRLGTCTTAIHKNSRVGKINRCTS
ncbi:hypothetical protein [Tunturiibacter lichenicola]|uniref:hypothetical protein n=1 Tax=Tunturiibacter lichenicola TaxID=2051959 RepID=UPI003D9BE2C5